MCGFQSHNRRKRVGGRQDKFIYRRKIGLTAGGVRQNKRNAAVSLVHT